MKSFCIIGMNRFGQALAMTLANSKKQVMIIDDNPQIVNSFADIVTAAVIGDPKEENVLISAGVADYDCCVVCHSGEIDDSILITLLLKDIGCKFVVARAQSDLHIRILKKVGADRVVYPERDMGERLANLLSKNNVHEYFELSDNCSIAEITIPDKWVGKNIAELEIRKKFNINIIGTTVAGGKMNVSPDPMAPFEDGTAITIVGEKKNIDKILNVHN